MSKGEASKIKIKPGKYCYVEENKSLLYYTEDESVMKSMREDGVFFLVELIDWVTRVDLLGDRQLIKTINKRGEGF